MPVPCAWEMKVPVFRLFDRYNTRLFKTSEGAYELRLAGAESGNPEPVAWDGHTITVRVSMPMRYKGYDGNCSD